MADTLFHPLTADFGLVLPPDARVQTRPQGLAAEFQAQRWRLTALYRPVPAAANARDLHAAAAASLAKRTPELQPASLVLDTGHRGRSGLASRLSSKAGRTVQLVTLLLPGTGAQATQVVLALDAESGAIPPGLPLAWLQRKGEAPAETSTTAQQQTGARFEAHDPGTPSAHTRPVATTSHGSAPLAPDKATNPYAAPETLSLGADSDMDDAALLDASQGQRILVYCVLLRILTSGLPDEPMLLRWAVAVALLAWAFRGVLLIASGFGYGRGTKLGLLFASTVPLIGIGVWVWLSIITTRALHDAGYRVGLFGVRS
jgi:hypothetical protein